MINYTYESLFRQDSIDKQIHIVGDGIELDNSQIYQGSFELTEDLNVGDDLTFGSCNSSSIKFTTSAIDSKFIGKYLTVSMTIGGHTDEEFLVGTYKVTEETWTANREQKDIVAYDVMYEILNANVATWYDELTFPITLANFRHSLFTFFGVEEVATTLVNDSMLVYRSILPDTLTGGDVVRSICEINGAFGRITRDNKFEYVTLQTAKKYDIYPYMYTHADYEDYEVQAIDSLIIRQEENDIGASVGVGDNQYVVQGNFLAYGLESGTLAQIAENLYSVISVPVYIPTSINAIGNPCVETGDMVSLITKEEGYNDYNTYPYYNTSGHTHRGVVWTVNEDYSISANGTPSGGNSNFSCHTRNPSDAYPMILPNGKYFARGCPSGGANARYRVEYRSNIGGQNVAYGTDIGDGIIFEVNGDDYFTDRACVQIVCIVYNGYTANNITFKPEIYRLYPNEENLVPYPYYHVMPRTTNGITFTEGVEHSIIANGTASANASEYTSAAQGVVLRLDAGFYYAEGCPAGGNDNTNSAKYSMRIGYWETEDSGSSRLTADVGNGVAFEVTPEMAGKKFALIVYIWKNAVVENLEFKPKLYKILGDYKDTFVLSRRLKGVQSIKDEYTALGNKNRMNDVNPIKSELLQLMGKSNKLDRTLEHTISEVTDLSTAVTTVTQTAEDLTIQVQNLQEQLDAETGYYERDGEPTLLNYPYWDFCTNIPCNNTVRLGNGVQFVYTEQDRKEHMRDLCVDLTTGNGYRFVLENNVWQWKLIADSDFGILFNQITELRQDMESIETTVSNTTIEVDNHESRITQNTSNISQQATEITAKVNSVDANSSNTFSWQMKTSGVDFKSNGSTVFKINSSGAEINGKVTAKSGYIGNGSNGFTISSTAFYNGKSSAGSNSAGIYIGTSGISLGANNAFRVFANPESGQANVYLNGVMQLQSAGEIYFSGSSDQTSVAKMLLSAGDYQLSVKPNGLTVSNLTTRKYVDIASETGINVINNADGYATYMSASSTIISKNGSDIRTILDNTSVTTDSLYARIISGKISSGTAGDLYIGLYGGDVTIGSRNKSIELWANKMSFFGAGAVSKPTVTYSSVDTNTALFNLLSALSLLGLISFN